MLLKKNNWAYEKIGDISEKILAGGDKPKVFSEVMTNECYIPVYANGVYNNGLCGYTNMPIIKDECITISARGTIGFCCIRTTPFVPIVRLIVVVPKSSITNKFLCYALRNLNIEKNGGTIPQLTVPMIKGYVIPVPPLPEQSRIVEELDLLSNITEKKRQQLSELDNLAQSIFYDMFGDPVTNEKGWNTRDFSKCYKLSSGDGLSAKNIIKGDFPVYGGNGIVGYHIDYNMDGEYIIIGRVGALCGNVRNVIGKAFITDNAFILLKNVETVNVYLMYLLKIHNLRQYAREAMQPVISNTSLKNIKILLPPLNLQQLFAQKIEAIEKEKELIKQSIAETEELFNSRMDYYFS